MSVIKGILDRYNAAFELKTDASRVTAYNQSGTTTTLNNVLQQIYSLLGGKAASSHTHTQANIIGLEDALDGKVQYIEATYNGTAIDLSSYRNDGIRAFNILLHNQQANVSLNSIFSGVTYVADKQGAHMTLASGNFIITLIIYVSGGYYYAVGDAVGPLYLSGD